MNGEMKGVITDGLGRKARIVATDVAGEQPILALVTSDEGRELMLRYNADGSYFLRGDTVIKFLQKNETSNDADIIYVETDHFLSIEEIASIKIKHKHEEVYHTQGTD